MNITLTKGKIAVIDDEDYQSTDIRVNKKRKFIGCFDSELDAALAYNQAAKDNFGEFAFVNTIAE